MTIYFTNSELYPSFPGAPAPDGNAWPVGWVWWALEAGTKRWVSNPGEGDAVGQQINNGSLKLVSLSTGKIQGLPDYVAPMPPGLGLTYDQAVKAVVEGLTKTHGDATMTFTLNP